MNPVAAATMLGITAALAGLVIFAVVDGHPWLLAGLVILLIAGFVRWGRLG